MLGVVFVATSQLRVARSACPRVYGCWLTQLVRSSTRYVGRLFFFCVRYVNVYAAAKKQAHLEVEFWYNDVVSPGNDEVGASGRQLCYVCQADSASRFCKRRTVRNDLARPPCTLQLGVGVSADCRCLPNVGQDSHLTQSPTIAQYAEVSIPHATTPLPHRLQSKAPESPNSLSERGTRA